MTQDQLPLEAAGHVGNGEVAKLRGMTAASEHAGPEWNDRCDFVIWLKAATGEKFTSEDVRELAGDPPSPGAMGARFAAAASARIIKQVGWRTATRPQLHGHVLRQWRGIPAVERGSEG